MSAPEVCAAALGFVIAVIGLTLPETVTLRRVLRPRFIGVGAFGILLVGYAFNARL